MELLQPHRSRTNNGQKLRPVPAQGKPPRDDAVRRADRVLQQRQLQHLVLEQWLPRAYTKELYLEKVAALYEHMYDSYAERDENVYAEGA